MEETWKEFKENRKYIWYVSNKGNIKRFIKHNSTWEYVDKIKISNCGYERLTTGESVHRLVAQAFIPNPENKPQVNHIDGDKRNNCVENLEWMTAKENIAHKYKVLGYTTSDETRERIRKATTGENNPFYGRKHTEETKKKISQSKTGKKQSDEIRKKKSEIFKGENNPMYGKSHSASTRKKISEANKGKMCGVNNHKSIPCKAINVENNQEFQFQTKAELSKFLNVSYPTVLNATKHNKIVNGYLLKE